MMSCFKFMSDSSVLHQYSYWMKKNQKSSNGLYTSLLFPHIVKILTNENLYRVPSVQGTSYYTHYFHLIIEFIVKKSLKISKG
jgi:hypothetical protein